MLVLARLMLSLLGSAAVANSDVAPTSNNPLHRLDLQLASSGRARHPGSVKGFHKPTETRVVRVVLTGGPCAGKTSSLVAMTEAAKREGFDVYRAPECATLCFNCGFSFPDADDPQFEEKVLMFQKALFKLQLQMERSMTLMAASTGRPSIIIFDRGLMDGKAYMTAESWQQLLHDVAHEGRDVVLMGRDLTEDYILQRYDGIIHMTTAADGAADHYRYGQVCDDHGNHVYRRETPEEAIALDRKTQRCWTGHSRHVVVGNPQADGSLACEDGARGGPLQQQQAYPDERFSYFVEKLGRATEVVLDIARRAHPQMRDARPTMAGEMRAQPAHMQRHDDS